MDIKHELTTIGCYLLAAFAGALIGWGLAEDLMVVLDVMEVSGNVETAFLLAGALVFIGLHWNYSRVVPEALQPARQQLIQAPM